MSLLGVGLHCPGKDAGAETHVALNLETQVRAGLAPLVADQRAQAAFNAGCEAWLAGNFPMMRTKGIQEAYWRDRGTQYRIDVTSAFSTSRELV